MNIPATPLVSPAFESFLAEAEPTDKQEAIVIFRPTRPPAVTPRGKRRELKARLDAIKAQAAKDLKPLKERLSDEYRSDAKKVQPASVSLGLTAQSVGGRSFPVMKVEVTPKTLEALTTRPEVAAILPNQPIHPIRPQRVNYARLGQTEKQAGLTWGLRHLEIDDLWAQAGTKGAGVRVAVLDTGIYAEHAALQGRLVKDGFAVFDSIGRHITADPPFDAEGHGTHVCGTAVGDRDANGVAIGVAPEAELLAANVLLGGTTLLTFISGLFWAVENGANVLNLSIGLSRYEPLFEEVLKLVAQYDVLPVVAIGNRSHGNLDSPGSSPLALGVGALEKMPRARTAVADFSGGASLVLPDAQGMTVVTKPDIVAPGVQVYSCIPPTTAEGVTHEYNYMDGTSMATPHVTGIVALLMAAFPSVPASDIMAVLKTTARHISPHLRPDNPWGYGAIRPRDAFDALNS